MSAFETAVDAIVTGDETTLRQLLHDHPQLVHERSEREHKSTLLHYVGANGVEGFRQRTPPNIVTIARMLLDAGADVNAEANVYGGGYTTLGLVATSVHPEKAGCQLPLMELLLDAGARLDQPSAQNLSKSIVAACYANGQPEAARFLAEHGAQLDLTTAAVLGPVEVVARYVVEAKDDPDFRSSVERAFINAAGYGRDDVVDFFLKSDLDVEWRSLTEALEWAKIGKHPTIVNKLLAAGWMDAEP